MWDLFIPSRYEALQNKGISDNDFKYFIYPVHEALKQIDEIYLDMEAAYQGAFLIMLGKSGSGKTTFLHTLPIFRVNIEITSIKNNENIATFLNNLKKTDKAMRVIIVEGREAMTNTSDSELEGSIHAINQFMRSDNGLHTLVVWLCNKMDIKDNIVQLALKIGGESLINNSQNYLNFLGPKKEQFIEIAQKTINILNEGASLLNLGIKEDEALEMIDKSGTIGEYLSNLRMESLKRLKNIKNLTKAENCKMWVIVIAGNEPKKEVSALTSGNFARVDIDRLMGATGANIVEEIKQYPNSIGQLSTYWDCKIIHMPIVTMQAVIRDYANEKLKKKMKESGLSTKGDKRGKDKLQKTDLFKILSNKPMGVGTRGSKPGGNSTSTFEKIALLASTNDTLLNEALAAGLKDLGIIKRYELEKDFGTGLTRRTDIICHLKDDSTVRLEIMWRKKTGQAEIANYVLQKIFNYGKATGII